MNATFFQSPPTLRQWFEGNHAQAKELWIGFHKKECGTTGICYAEALDEALCFGWIDGVRRSVDEKCYLIRFSPRKAHSIWSLVNIKRAEELILQGRMQPAGLKAFEQHDLAQAEQHSYERCKQPLDASCEAIFQSNPQAWDFFQAQAPFYWQSATAWVMSAKLEATQQRRLAQLMDASAKGERIPQLLGKAKE